MKHEDPSQFFNLLSDVLERATGQTLLPNRHWRIETVLKPVLGRNSIPDLKVLTELLASGSDKELEIECIDAMLNNETSFFRDQPNFALLTGPVLDFVRACRSDSKVIRIWCNACSTGQEPYSLAMAIAENAEKWAGWKIEIIATDVSATALRKAKSGSYTQFEIQRGLPVMLMLRYFDQIGTDWQLKESIQKMVSFRQANALQPTALAGKFDLILCRNMLMYFGDGAKRTVLDNLANAAHANTLLMLGAAETVIGQTERFEASSEFRGFYTKSADSGAQLSKFARMDTATR
jgi:chemotaxis protein methyltransferase CheR